VIRRFRPHMKILPHAQQRLWAELAPASRLGLVLYGGTAIALRVGHRFSVDFDFFTDKELDKKALWESFAFMRQAVVIQEGPDTLSLLVGGKAFGNEHVKVSFFGNIGFGRVGEPELTEDGVLQVASLIDLMATKLKVILQRVEAKDYRDVAAMLEIGVSLGSGLAAAKAMYGQNFQPSESLKALVYFEGGDLHTLSSVVKESLIKAVAGVRALPHIDLVAGELALQATEYKPGNECSS
jgi:hypothetical protein